MDSHMALRGFRARACAALTVVVALVGSGTADARRVSEQTARDVETTILGPSHAREHAIERTHERRALRRWRAMSPRQRRAGVRHARLATLHAASAAPASEVGQWDPTQFSLPVHAIHSAVLPTGKVMIWSYPFQATETGTRLLETHAYIWDPSVGTGPDSWHEVSPPADESSPHAMIFCGGGSLLADGRLLTTGGTLYWPDKAAGRPKWAGIKDVWTFDPWDETWKRQPDTRQGRWYPTQTELADGRTVILGGYDENGQQAVDTDLEVFTPSADPHGVGKVDRYPDADFAKVTIYPHLFTMPDGKVLLAGPTSYESGLLTVGKDHAEWANTKDPNDWRTLGTAFLEPGGPAGSTRVTLAGGTDPPADTSAPVTPARDTTETYDEAHLDIDWQPGTSMNVPRSNFNTVVLPDRSVVAIGGSNGTSKAEGLYASWDDHRSRQVDIRDPQTHQWRLGPAQQEDRAYHSTAVLLPDGRVLSGGDDRPGMRTSDTGEIYSPPYLFRGDRPLIGAAPQKLGYGQAFRVGASGGATQAVLMAPGVTTHGTEMQARYVKLAVTRTNDTGLDLVAPPSGGVAPPGYYMLFLLNDKGVPSVARWVHVDQPEGGPQPPPKPHFGASTRVSVVTRKARLRGRELVLKVTNANAFKVPANATLRLRKSLSAASLSPAARTSATIPAHGTVRLTLRLGNRKAKYIRHVGHLGGALRLVVTDPAGGKRTVSGHVRVWAKRKR